MGLQVWLPLNKDTRNNGLSNVTVTNNGATLANDGVFDKCYSFDGSNDYISIPYNSFGSNFSISIWFYRINNGSSSWMFTTRNAVFGGIGVFIDSSSNALTIDCASNAVSTSRWATSTSITSNRWYHLAIVRNQQKIWYYINGSFVEEKQIEFSNTFGNIVTICCRNTNGSDITSFSSYKINDFRIYDHCITEEDVKRLYNCKIMDIVATNYNNGFFYDNSGLNINKLVSTGLTFSGNSMYFNGSTTQIRTKSGVDGLNISGGTLSVWFNPIVKPSAYSHVYNDAKSKMVLGFYDSGNRFCCSTPSANTAFSTANIVFGGMNNVVVTYDSAYTPLFCYINGVKAATSESTKWNLDSGLTIGGRQYNTANKFNGYISKVTVYRNQLTEDETKQLYAIGPQTETDFSQIYTRLEYIDSTWTKRIDTGIKGHMSYTYELEFQQIDTGNYRNWGVFGQSSYVGPNMSLTWSSGFALRWENLNNSTNMINSISSVDTNKHFVRIVNGELYWDGVDKGKSAGHKNDFVINYNLFLGTINPGGTTPSTNAKSKYYLYKVYDENGVLIQNLIPAKRKSDNVIGMYDLVTKTFFTNAGTGTFTAGPEI